VREGLLWFDTDKRRTPQEKLDQAAARFAERLGKVANVCHVHPLETFLHDSIRVVADPAVLKGHLWVGRDDELAPRRRKKQIA
jgi:hypothetical protein